MQRLVSKKGEKRIFDIIQIGKKDDFVSRVFDIFIAATILANLTILFMETFEQLNQYAEIFRSKVTTGVKRTVSITVDNDSPFLNQSVQQIESVFGIDVIALVRKGAVIQIPATATAPPLPPVSFSSSPFWARG